MSRKALTRFAIAAAVIGAMLFVDGLVLSFTNGLKTDASPILPVLGGTFSKTRSSGASLIVLGVVLVVLALVGRWWLTRRVNAQDRGDTGSSGAAPACKATPQAPMPAIDVETREPAAPA
jgi:protein-S-isoprenylcysteine O-methyltransferase Ste14